MAKAHVRTRNNKGTDTHFFMAGCSPLPHGTVSESGPGSRVETGAMRSSQNSRPIADPQVGTGHRPRPKWQLSRNVQIRPHLQHNHSVSQVEILMCENDQ